MLKVFLCAAGLSVFATGCSFPTEDYRTVPTERVSDESSEEDGDAGAKSEAAPSKTEPEDKKGKGKEDN
jgi:hypothetical protein